MSYLETLAKNESEEIKEKAQNALKLLVETSPHVEDLNEVERGEYISAILHGVTSTFEGPKVVVRREYSLSGTNGKVLPFEKNDELQYAYGIVTTGDRWYFTIVSSDNEIGAISESIDLQLENFQLNDSYLNAIRTLFAVIRTILSDIMESFDEEPQTKRQRLLQLLGN
ncbi:4839_t:CDS:2 [Racocetra fulgida]|uniref:4839_t:CDS:1 n=1 Tax=Racocetra fulgida TaxID=60492 RepID=A0A9N9BQ56_9GLOM|nr:4839_t:CDS:2 [Racocetra fulgida]